MLITLNTPKLYNVQLKYGILQNEIVYMHKSMFNFIVHFYSAGCVLKKLFVSKLLHTFWFKYNNNSFTTTNNNYNNNVGRDSSVVIATRYGIDGPGIESRWRRDFPHLSRPALWPTQPPAQWVPVLSRGLRRSGRGVDHPSVSSAEVKEDVELYLYSPFRPLWPVLR